MSNKSSRSWTMGPISTASLCAWLAFSELTMSNLGRGPEPRNLRIATYSILHLISSSSALYLSDNDTSIPVMIAAAVRCDNGNRRISGSITRCSCAHSPHTHNQADRHTCNSVKHSEPSFILRNRPSIYMMESLTKQWKPLPYFV